MGKLGKILLVDDDQDILQVTSMLLSREGHEVQMANSGKGAIEKLETFTPDLVLLDMKMPGMHGLETIEHLRKIKSDLAVIFVTATAETADVIRGLEAGAMDYISKPFSGMELLARVRTQLRIKSLQDQLRQANEKLKDLVEIDDLTGLFNMRSIYKKLDNEIERARRHEHGVAAIMLDMDHFKRVNDNHDHLFGSHVLTEVGQLIKSNIRGHDFAARYGGDEFLICLSQTTAEGAERFCERLRKVLEQHLYKHGEDEIKLTASMGCAVIKKGRSLMDARSLVRHADHNLYASKNEGRNKVTFSEIEEDGIDTDRQSEKRSLTSSVVAFEVMKKLS